MLNANDPEIADATRNLHGVAILNVAADVDMNANVNVNVNVNIIVKVNMNVCMWM